MLNLDPNFDPFTTVPIIYAQMLDAPFPTASGTWNAAGWREFAVTGSSGQGWNEVFRSNGAYTFTADWDGDEPDMSVHFGIESATFNQMYGKWIENNPSVYTYFGLYVHPNTGEAQDPNQEPIGLFAFVASDPLLYPSGFSLEALYEATRNGPIEVLGGSGTFAATPVPEPTSLILLGTGLGVIGLGAWRRMK